MTLCLLSALPANTVWVARELTLNTLQNPDLRTAGAEAIHFLALEGAGVPAASSVRKVRGCQRTVPSGPRCVRLHVCVCVCLTVWRLQFRAMQEFSSEQLHRRWRETMDDYQMGGGYGDPHQQVMLAVQQLSSQLRAQHMGLEWNRYSS